MSCNGCKAKDLGACTAHGGTGWDPRAGPHPCPEAVKIKRYGALDDSSYARVCPHCGKSEADIIDSEQFQAQARLLREPRAAVIGRERRKQRLPLIDADVLQATSGIQGAATAIQGTIFRDVEPKRCQMCGDVLVNTELNDHDVERGVCHSCYAAEVTAGDVW